MENYDLSNSCHDFHNQSYDLIQPKENIRSIFKFWRKMEENIPRKHDNETKCSFLKFSQEMISVKDEKVEEIKAEEHIDECPEISLHAFLEDLPVCKIQEISSFEENQSNSENQEDKPNAAEEPKNDIQKENDVNKPVVIPMLSIPNIKNENETSPVLKKRRQFAKYKRKTILPHTPDNMISKIRKSYLRNSMTVVSNYQEFLTFLENNKLNDSKNNENCEENQFYADNDSSFGSRSRSFTNINKDTKEKRLSENNPLTKSKKSSAKKKRHSLLLIQLNQQEQDKGIDNLSNSESRRSLWGLIKSKRKISGHKGSKSEPPSPKNDNDERSLLRSRSIATSLNYYDNIPSSPLNNTFQYDWNKQLFGLPLYSFTFGGKVPSYVPSSCLKLLELNSKIPISSVYKIVKYIIKNPQQLDIIDTSSVSEEENETEFHLKSLALYFKNLENPLCPTDLYDMFMYTNTVSDDTYRLRLLHSLICSLPELNRKIFEFILKFLFEYANGNKRLLKKLCLLYGQFFFRNNDATDPETQPITENIDSLKKESLRKSIQSYTRAYVRSLIKSIPCKILLDAIYNPSIFQLNFQDMLFHLHDGDIKIESASVFSLVYLLTDEFYNEENYVNIFFMTYSLFTTPLYVLKTLISLYHYDDKDDQNCEWNHRRQLRIIEILETWFMNFQHFDITPEFMDVFDSMKTSKHEYEWKKLKNILIKHSSDDEISIDDKYTEDSFSDDESSLDISEFNPVDVAKAITIVDMKNFKEIKSFELIHSLNNSKPSSINNMICKFNKLNVWVQTKILSCELMEQRISNIVYFSKVLQELLRHNNFNSALSVYSGLTSTYICKHLPKTWRKGKKKISKTLDQANEIFSMDKNFKNYIEKIKSEMIAIPIVLILLKNLTSLKELFETESDDGRVNFDKMRQIYNEIEQFQKYQSSTIDFNVNKRLIHYFENFSTLEEEELETLSRRLIMNGQK